jgi:hypothetical protein
LFSALVTEVAGACLAYYEEPLFRRAKTSTLESETLSEMSIYYTTLGSFLVLGAEVLVPPIVSVL